MKQNLRLNYVLHAEEVMKQQLEVDCTELRGHFSYEEGKYFPACLHFSLVRAQRLFCSLPTCLTRFFIVFFLTIFPSQNDVDIVC